MGSGSYSLLLYIMFGVKHIYIFLVKKCELCRNAGGVFVHGYILFCGDCRIFVSNLKVPTIAVSPHIIKDTVVSVNPNPHPKPKLLYRINTI